MSVEHIHHLDIVVHDLDQAVERYRQVLGKEPLDREHLPHRGVALARFRLGETWLILVQPLTAESPVQKFLDEHGEGFFHIAYKVDNVEAKVASLAGQGIHPPNPEPRRGVEGWKLVDLDMADTFGVLTQFVEEG